MSRASALQWIRIAGYHSDQRAFIRLFTENRVSRKAADQAYAAGQSAKASGMPCNCHQCKEARAA